MALATTIDIAGADNDCYTPRHGHVTRQPLMLMIRLRHEPGGGLMIAPIRHASHEPHSHNITLIHTWLIHAVIAGLAIRIRQYIHMILPPGAIDITLIQRHIEAIKGRILDMPLRMPAITLP